MTAATNRAPTTIMAIPIEPFMGQLQGMSHRESIRRAGRHPQAKRGNRGLQAPASASRTR
jgi:hypothetical protein